MCRHIAEAIRISDKAWCAARWPSPSKTAWSEVRGVGGQMRGQLGSVADAKFLEDAGQMCLDGAPRNEEILCDRPVAVPTRRERGDPQFRWGQRVHAEQGGPTGPGTRGVEFGA